LGEVDSSDVLICGGGLAGLTLALQLRQAAPDRVVTVLERQEEPLPEACFKVGESLAEIATTYFDRTLGLGENLRSRQLVKLGLRFFLGGGDAPIEARDEVGLRVFPPFTTYQIDRGRFETDLRARARDAGVRFRDGRQILKMDIGGAATDHVVLAREPDGETRTYGGRWLIDATGRRRLLQRRLRLTVNDNGHRASAAWFRVKGHFSLADLAPNDAAAWRGRILEDRWRSTVLLVGRGYWIWLIGLATGYTSVGVVVQSDLQPSCQIGPDLSALTPWLEREQPLFAEALASMVVCDFCAIRDFSYGARKVFSEDRWACVGEAATFLDPFNSPGNDFIGIGNTIATELILRDLRGEHDPQIVRAYDDLFLRGLYTSTLAIFCDAYEAFGAPITFTVKHIWDSAVYWGVHCQLYMQGLLACPQVFAEVQILMERLTRLEQAVQGVLAAWARLGPEQRRRPAPLEAGYLDPSLIPFLQLLVLDLNVARTPEQTVALMWRNLARYEEAAQVIFFEALADALPQELARFPTRWVNPYAISLNPDSWEGDGLFAPEAAARELRPIAQGLFGGVLVPLTRLGRTRRALMKGFMRLARGKVFYAVTPRITRAIRAGRFPLPRWLFMIDQPVVNLDRLTSREASDLAA